MAPWIVGYGMFLITLFTVCTATLGLNTTAWGFAVTFMGCTVTSLFLWWRDEQQWNVAHQGQEPTPITITPLSHSVMAETLPLSQDSRHAPDWVPLKDDDFDLLDTYTKNLTERVESVYPVVDRDHIHKIVWTVMIELFCKRMDASSYSTPASAITARITRAA